jgi:isoamylase
VPHLYTLEAPQRPLLARALGAAALVVTAFASACGGAGSELAGGSGGAGTSVTTTGSSTTSSVTTTGAGSGGSGGQGGEAPAPPAALELTVRSERATRIEVHVFDAPTGSPARLSRVIPREPGSDRWSISIPREEIIAAGVPSTVYYGLRVWGPNWPYDPAWTPGSTAGFVADVDDEGNRFNPNKLLLDPYAREMSHDPTTPEHADKNVYRTGPDYRGVDSAPFAPKAILLDEALPAVGPRPTRPLRDEVIYEVHVRGFTRSDPSVTEACRGTFAGAAEKAGYLAALGVTAIELLPIQETANARNDVEQSTSGDNYWGYSTLAFFAPDRRYACDASPGGPTRELAAMVRAMHEQGIKVYLDVVYNHTAEGGVGNPNVATTLSLRGLDNAGYYELGKDKHLYFDNNGVGANTNAKSPMFRDLVIDSLRYLHDAIGVDGFRFDLAPILANACTSGCFDFDPDDPEGILTRVVKELPARPADGGEGADLIAEPWGIGQGTYQLGHFPKGWSEWNGGFRDTVRRDMNRLDLVNVTPRELLFAITGSPERFADDGRSPAASINFVVAHDGFTLRDLHSCNEKNNSQPWPYGPSSGGEDNNLSWDYGGDPVRQRQAARTALSLLLLSAGVPMITGGDELYRTQYCNNNAYNLDASTNWLDWSLPETFPEHAAYVRELLHFRNAHPALRPTTWNVAKDLDGNGMVDWAFLTDLGVPTTDAYLDNPSNHFLAWRVDGGPSGDTARSIYVAYNGTKFQIEAQLPKPAPGFSWYHVLDTSPWLEPKNNIHPAGAEELYPHPSYGVGRRAVVVFVERKIP